MSIFSWFRRKKKGSERNEGTDAPGWNGDGATGDSTNDTQDDHNEGAHDAPDVNDGPDFDIDF